MHSHPVDAALEADWLTLWQSELAALAVDREAREQALAALRAWAAPHDGAPGQHELPPGRPGADAPPRPAPPGAAPEPRASAAARRELDRLRRRIAELGRDAVPGPPA